MHFAIAVLQFSVPMKSFVNIIFFHFRNGFMFAVNFLFAGEILEKNNLMPKTLRCRISKYRKDEEVKKMEKKSDYEEVRRERFTSSDEGEFELLNSYSVHIFVFIRWYRASKV